METFILKLNTTADGSWDGEVEHVDPRRFKENVRSQVHPVKSVTDLLEAMEKSMSKYKLLAFDMDGTLLDSNKEIRESSLTAIKKAVAAGKDIAICTGRAVCEVDKYRDQLEDIRYMVCLSGGLVVDRKENKKIYTHSIPRDVVKECIRIANMEDSFMQLLSTESIVEKEKSSRMADYTIPQYQALFDEVATKVENLQEWFDAQEDMTVEKFNISSRDFETADRTWERLKAYPLEILQAEGTMIELSAPGLSKAVGLQKLAEYAGITLDEMIMVGDGNNDLEALKAVGLAIGMGNCFHTVREVADVIVADNDHDGCAEAIEKYLLAE